MQEDRDFGKAAVRNVRRLVERHVPRKSFRAAFAAVVIAACVTTLSGEVAVGARSATQPLTPAVSQEPADGGAERRGPATDLSATDALRLTGTSLGGSGTQASGAKGLADLPMAAQAAVSGTLGREGVAYRITKTGTQLRAVNQRNGISAQFGSQGLAVRSGQARLGLVLTGYGYGRTLRPVRPAAPGATANRVEYARGPVTEWYVNGPLGLEQGFTLAKPPAGKRAGPLTLSLSLSGNLRGAVARGGDAVTFTGSGTAISYRGLTVIDARGHSVPARLELLRGSLLIRVSDARAAYPLLIDPLLQQFELTASDGAAGDTFGNSVAVSGSTIVVGAPDHAVGDNSRQGAAYVYELSGGAWSQTAELTALDGAADDNFGTAVAITGSFEENFLRIVVGAPGRAAAAGAAYVYQFSGNTWSGTAQLTAGRDGEAGDRFGTSVAVSGSTIVVGHGHTPHPPTVYVYGLSGGSWVQTGVLHPGDAIASRAFGDSVAVSGSTIVVGDPTGDGTHGAAHVYGLVVGTSGSTWSPTAVLTASDGADADSFGKSVAISGSTIVVGAPRGGDNNQGAAYVYSPLGGAWSQTGELSPSDGAGGDDFGESVAISGSSIVVGAPWHLQVGRGVGAAYEYRLVGSVWSQTAVLTASDGGFDFFGSSVAVSGTTIVVGAPNHTVGDNSAQGAAYVPGSAVGDDLGYSVVVSGSTIVVGAPHHAVGGNDGQGAAYVYELSGGSWSQTAELTASDGAAEDRFGTAVGVWGSTIVVGAPNHTVAGNEGQGAAYAYSSSGGSWSQTTQLREPSGRAQANFGSAIAVGQSWVVVGAPSGNFGLGGAYVYNLDFGAPITDEAAPLVAVDGALGDRFGSSVGIWGSTIVVGAPAHKSGQGAAYVFHRPGLSWLLTAELTTSDGAAGDAAGYSVAVSGPTIVVGAPNHAVDGNGAQGAAYVYRRSGGSWTQTATLTAGDGAADDLFGHSVAISVTRIVVGAPNNTDPYGSGQGATYVYDLANSSWEQTNKLFAVFGGAADALGQSVGVSGATIVVGVPGGNFGQGAAHVYGSCEQACELTASDGADGDEFGLSVAISGSLIVVGAPLATVSGNSHQGAVYVYSLSDALSDEGFSFTRVWSQIAKLTASDGAAQDLFGSSVAISGSTIVVGAPNRTIGGNFGQGAAYVYELSDPGSWSQTAKLTASDGIDQDQFGLSVGVSGSTIVVGAHFHDDQDVNEGAAYVYGLSGGSWPQIAELTASDAAGGDEFGYSVAVSGSTIVVGAPFRNVGAHDDQGAAYVYGFSGGSWSETAELTGSGGAASDEFGTSVGVSGSTIAVGAPKHAVDGHVNQGAAYVYGLSGGSWPQTAELTASDGGSGSGLGYSVSVSGSTIAAGASHHPVDGNGGQGAAYAFVLAEGSWSQTAVETAAGDGATHDNFGNSVGVDSEVSTIVAGAPFHAVDGSEVGAAYQFVLAPPPTVTGVTGVSSTAANGSYGVGASVPVTVSFSEAVTVTGTPRLALNSGGTASYSGGSGTSTLTFSYTVAAGENANPLDEASSSALSLNGGTITAAGNPVDLTLPVPGTAGSLGVNKSIVIDTSAPTVSGVSSPSPNGRYGVGSLVPITVFFTETMTVTGTPLLALNSGGTASYSGGSGTSTLTFSYTVAAGENANPLDEASSSALSLNGGTIRDAASNAADLTLPAQGAAGSLGVTKSIVIDGTVPTVTGVSSTAADGTYGVGASVPITVSFSEPVTVTGAPQLALNSGGTASYSGGSGTQTLTFAYTVAPGEDADPLDEASSSALSLNGGTIRDGASNGADLTLPAPGTAGSLGVNKSIVIDTSAPTVSGVSSTTADGAYGVGAVLPITVSFTERVTVTGTPQLALNSGGTASYSGGSGTSTLTFSYTVAAGESANPLDEASSSALSLNGGTIRDGASNAADLTLPAPGTAGSLGANKVIVIDTTPPTFEQHADVTVPATSLAGAAVSYSVVVSDPDTLASELTILCVPASGSTFPLRANGATKATTVTCNAHDPADNDATPMSFMVTVLGADDQISGLAAAVAGAGLPKAVRDSLNGQLAKADKELAKALGGPPVDAFRHYIEALGALDEFVHRVSDETTRSSHPKDPIGPALAADLINAALQSERLCAPADFAALDQLITLAGQVYLSPDLAAGKQDGLRYALADLLLKAETKYLQGEQALAGGGAQAQSDANGKFKQAQEHLGQFIQNVQQNTAGPQRPNGPISQPASTAFVTGAQQASATIGALIH